MDKYIAYCGLDCKKCDAYIATINDDDALRQRVARLWSEWNQAEITPDMIHCQGCRVDGVKTPYCDALCPIRQCAAARALETCGDCGEKAACQHLAMITGNDDDARRNLGMV